VLGFCLAAVTAVAATQTIPADAQDTANPQPGTRPQNTRLAAAAAAATEGLQLVANERGRISRSVAAVATDTTDGAQLTIRKPARATVRKAFLAVTTTGFTNTPLTTAPTIDGTAIPLDRETRSGINSYNYLADVTTLVSNKINGAPAGPVGFAVAEPQPELIDGEVMIVIYDDPSVTVDQTVSVLYGALSPTGDRYGIELARPISLADTQTRLEMSLGISYSCQTPATCTGAGQQYSQVDVNGTRLTGAAGGEDDGAGHNGSLITAGGEGDSLDNPANPTALPTGPTSDDELYDLRPFVHTGDSKIEVTTSNPSLDDNVFLATFAMNPPVTGITSAPAGNQPPVFSTYRQGTVYPTPGAEGFQIAASDPDGDPVTLSWSLLPLRPVEVTCDPAATALTAITFCRLRAASGIDLVNEITFTATDSKGARSTVVVKVGPAYYLGMGDSYASGEGNPPFDPGTDARSNFPLNTSNGSCHRSDRSWQRWLDIDAPYAMQAHISCSGADTNRMKAASFKGETGQIRYLKNLAHKPNLIELTVGGNDANFGVMVGACYAGGHTGACPAAITATNVQIRTTLRNKLISTYRAIHDAAPKAKIVVVGYPNVISDGLTAPARCPWTTRNNLTALKLTASNLDSAIRSAVAAMAPSDNVFYVSTLDVLRGHELCTGDSWVRAVQLRPNDIANGSWSNSAHPNDPGQQAIRRRVSAWVASH
jgi:hypothetical protein